MDERPTDLGLGGDASGGVPSSTAPANQAESPVNPTGQDLVPPVVVVSENERSKRGLPGVLGVLPLLLGPMVLAASLAYSFVMVNNANTSFDIRSKAASNRSVKVTETFSTTPQMAAIWRTTLANLPKNPTTVTATISQKGVPQTITSGGSYPAASVTFTWDQGVAVEPGTKIAGYYVYFGPKDTQIPFPDDGYRTSVDPYQEGVKVTTNSYTADNLIKGQTYHLFIRSFTDSKNFDYKNGVEVVSGFRTLPAKELFSYTYQ